ncbi:hypothetical protein AB0I93_16725 [Streptomyces sp. NPDC049967]|nr:MULTISPECIES: hypothetical protein [unclassified Streptomyces]WSJ23146.1 hypothetical protein OG384_14725 [Streptomyces sp. NBC_01324]
MAGGTSWRAVRGEPTREGGRESGEGAGFLCLSFLVVLGLWALDPKDR